MVSAPTRTSFAEKWTKRRLRFKLIAGQAIVQVVRLGPHFGYSAAKMRAMARARAELLRQVLSVVARMEETVFFPRLVGG